MNLLYSGLLLTTLCAFLAAVLVSANEQKCTQLAELVRVVSKARVEVRKLSPWSKQCQTFVNQLTQDAGELSLIKMKIGKNRDELLGEIVRLLRTKVACSSGPVVDQLSSLSDFVSECLDLIESADQMKKINKLKNQVKNLIELQAGHVRTVRFTKSWDGKVGLLMDSFQGGLFVVLLSAGSPAARAGLRFGDQILEINGQPTLGLKWPYVRNQPNELEFVVRRSPFEQNLVIQKDGEGKLGIQLAENGRVTSITKDSPAARAGLMQEMTIIAVNGVSVIGLSRGELELELDEIWAASGEVDQKNGIRLTLLPSSIFAQLIKQSNPQTIRSETNKILEDEKRLQEEQANALM